MHDLNVSELKKKKNLTRTLFERNKAQSSQRVGHLVIEKKIILKDRKQIREKSSQ